MTAHIQKYCYYVVIPMHTSYGIPYTIEFWAHDNKVNGIPVDGAQERYSDVILAREKTFAILKSIMSNSNYKALLS